MLRLTARAKINWSLEVVGRRPDGYHLLDMLMQSVALADTLTAEKADALTLQVEGAPELDTEDNLVFKAARLLRAKADSDLGARLTLIKRVPSGAGMGGGSADAAAALVGLDRLWNLRLPEETLLRLALRCGADVPFLLRGGLARVGGVGERLTALPGARELSLVVVQPCAGLSTREVFGDFDALAPEDAPKGRTDAAQAALLAGDLRALDACAGNALQSVSEAKRPEIGAAIAALRECGAAFSRMTGSGSAVFGAFANEDEAERAYRAMRLRWPKTWLTRTAAEGIAVEEIG